MSCKNLKILGGNLFSRTLKEGVILMKLVKKWRLQYFCRHLGEYVAVEDSDDLEELEAIRYRLDGDKQRYGLTIVEVDGLSPDEQDFQLRQLGVM
jgi:hypothetical protein